MMTEVQRMFYEAAAAEKLGIPEKVLKSERGAGRIGCRKVAGRFMYTESDLSEWIEARQNPEGKIYFIQGDKGSPIKIGFTSHDDIKVRILGLQGGNPQRLRLLHWTPGDRYHEKAMHRAFAADRLTGEWFSCTSRLLEVIRDLKAGVALIDLIFRYVEGPDLRSDNSRQKPSPDARSVSKRQALSTE